MDYLYDYMEVAEDTNVICLIIIYQVISKLSTLN